MSDIYCLMTSGLPLTQRARNLLVRIAMGMYARERRSGFFKSSTAEIHVRTKYKSGNLGSVFGYIFEADLATEAGETHACYIVRPFDIDRLDDGVWSEFREEDFVEEQEPAFCRN